jgi:hypothetical protein
VFPEYSTVADQLLNHEDFIDILKEFQACELAISQFNKRDEEAAIYRELMIELKKELQAFIFRHLGKQNSNIT